MYLKLCVFFCVREQNLFFKNTDFFYLYLKKKLELIEAYLSLRQHTRRRPGISSTVIS